MVVRPTLDVLVEVAADGLGAEVSTLSRPGVEQNIVGHLAELVAEPVVDGHPETHLRAPQDGLGQEAAHRPSQGYF